MVTVPLAPKALPAIATADAHRVGRVDSTTKVDHRETDAEAALVKGAVSTPTHRASDVVAPVAIDASVTTPKETVEVAPVAIDVSGTSQRVTAVVALVRATDSATVTSPIDAAGQKAGRRHRIRPDRAGHVRPVSVRLAFRYEATCCTVEMR